MNQQTLTTPAREEVTLGVTGMTCASCVRRIEKAFSRTPGVHEASVNLATEKATVVFDPTVAGLDQLTAAVEQAGYGVGALPSAPPLVPQRRARVPAPTAVAEPADPRERERQHELDDLRRTWQASLGVGLAMMALMYLPLDLDMTLVAPALLIAATVVQVWAGGVFYRAA